jgi:hypothetical protein
VLSSAQYDPHTHRDNDCNLRLEAGSKGIERRRLDLPTEPVASCQQAEQAPSPSLTSVNFPGTAEGSTGQEETGRRQLPHGARVAGMLPRNHNHGRTRGKTPRGQCAGAAGKKKRRKGRKDRRRGEREEDVAGHYARNPHTAHEPVVCCCLARGDSEQRGSGVSAGDILARCLAWGSCSRSLAWQFVGVEAKREEKWHSGRETHTTCTTDATEKEEKSADSARLRGRRWRSDLVRFLPSPYVIRCTAFHGARLT